MVPHSQDFAARAKAGKGGSQKRRTVMPATGGMPTIEDVHQAHRENFRQAHPGWEERLERDWEADRKLFQALTTPGADAYRLFRIAWMSGFRGALKERT